MAQLQSNSSSAKPNRGENLSPSQLKDLRDTISQNLPRIAGRIRRIKQDKGFGFIAGDDGIDYFFHWSTVKRLSPKDFRKMEVRDRVSFSPIKPPDHDWRAIEVEFVPE